MPSAPLLGGVFARVGLEREAREFQALYAWHRLAGERLGRHTRAEHVRGRTLVVRAASAPWANQLSYLRANLLRELQRTPGGEGIEELRFSIGPLAELPDFFEAPVAEAPMAKTVAPVVDRAAVTAALLEVRDPELRAAIADLFARGEAAR